MKRKNNNKTDYIKEYILNNRIFLAFIVFLVLIGLLVRIKTIGFPILFRATLADIVVILIISLFSLLFKSKGVKVYYFIWILFFSLLCIANNVYYNFYQSFISVNLINTASMIGQVNDSLWAKLHINQFIYLLFPIVFVILCYVFKNDNYEKRNNKKIFKTFICIILSLLIILVSTMSSSDGSRFVKLWNRESIVKRYGIYVYTINDLVQSMQPKINTLFGYDEAAFKFRNYYSCKTKNNNTNEYTGLFKGKNVIFIHAESFQNFLVDLKINGKEVTPNLNKLAKTGMYFKKFYPQISVGTSSDTEFTLNTGLMPSSSGTVFVNYYDRKYYAMPNYFNKLGYYTFSAHANNAEYWNRKIMHNNFGYNDFYAKDSFIVPTDNDSKDIVGLGLSDKSFFKQLIPILKQIKNNNTNYMGTIITLSNHSPFSDLEKYSDFDVSMNYSYIDEKGNKIKGTAEYLENSSMGNYLKSSHYADEALGQLFEDLENNQLLDNTIFILYGDHEARLSKREFDLLYNYDPVTNSVLDEDDENYYNIYNYNYELLKNTPFIIWSKDLNLESEIDKTMGMYDVLPTIANMFGFEEKFSLGKDIFDSSEGVVVFPNGNILTDKIYYSDLSDEYVAFTDEPIEIDYIDKLKKYADDILDVSNGIIMHDLIKREESKIGECISE